MNEDIILEQIEDNLKKFEEELKYEEQANNKRGSGLRYNSGKLRYDLVHPWAHEQMVKILTAGSLKYSPWNWANGMPWSDILSSLKRHLSAIENGEDYDKETGELHAAHLACNVHFLTAYYKIYPQGDDRRHNYLNNPKIGLDIDEILADWVQAWCEKFNYPIPEFWNFSYDNKEHFESMSKKEMENFYLSIPKKIEPSELPFEPHCYLTSRSIPIELTKLWLQNNGFPTVPVYCVPFGKSKVEVAKESGIEWFIDDSFKNFEELNNAGICTFLMTTKHNLRYDVGYRRIENFKDFKERFL